MRRSLLHALVVCAAGAVGAVALVAVASANDSKRGPDARASHVLLLSVDGLHQSDLVWYVNHNPRSALAVLVRGGVEFANAQTPFPSDSFPGMVGQVTGGNSSSTGVYYDDSWNTALLPAGTTKCAGVKPGVEVTYFEQLDRNPLALDAGQGLPGLPDGILKMTGDPRSLIDPRSCRSTPRRASRSTPTSI